MYEVNGVCVFKLEQSCYLKEFQLTGQLKLVKLQLELHCL